MSNQPIAIIAGVGPGTGGEIAKKFAKKYPVALLSRNPDNTTPLVKEIEVAGGKASAYSADVTSASSIAAAFDKIRSDHGTDRAAAAIFNASAGFKRAPFLELTEADFENGYRGSAHGGFIFAQAALPLLLKQTEAAGGEHPPTLIFTGATASVKGSALFAAFAPGKWALRALAQSLAREFGPKGVHVAHSVIDGLIDIPRAKEIDLGEGGKIDPVAIADQYWFLHTQPKTSFTFEVDLRPAVEKW